MVRQLVLGLVVAVAALVGAGAAGAGNGFFVGWTEDLPKETGSQAVAPGAALGGKAFRITLMWTPGQTELTATDATRLDRAIGAIGGAHLRTVLAVYADSGDKTPQTATAREEYCTYVRNVLGRYPTVADVVIWNEPNTSYFWRPQFNGDGSSAAPAAYGALAARCYDVLHAYRPAVNVIGPVLSSNGNDNPNATSNVAHSPGNFLRMLGLWYRASGRAKPLFDTIGHHAYGTDPWERPWRKHIGSKVIAQGDWNKLMSNLAQAFDGTAQALPGQVSGARTISLWYMESGFQTTVDPGKTGYYGTENETGLLPDFAGGEPESPPPAETSPAPDQHTQVLDSIRLASCQPYVEALFNFLLYDEGRLEGWQSGAYWVDGTPKDSFGGFASAISAANARSVDCAALKGGLPSADYTGPSAPTGLSATASGPRRVDLSWTASGDAASGVAGYRVYRNGTYRFWTTSTSFADTTVAPATTYSYTVYAQDGAGNLGSVSDKVFVTTPAEPAATFADVPSSHPFFAAIEDLYARGITTGCGTNPSGRLLYCPDASVLRQAMAAFVTRAMGLAPLTPLTPTFADVPATHTFYGPIERFAAEGITTGCGTNAGGQALFCPGDTVKRQAMAAFITRARGLAPLNRATPTFADVPATHAFYGQIERFYEEGITTGCGTNGAGQPLFCPDTTVTRQAMAAFLVRAFPATSP